MPRCLMWYGLEENNLVNLGKVKYILIKYGMICFAPKNKTKLNAIVIMIKILCVCKKNNYIASQDTETTPLQNRFYTSTKYYYKITPKGISMFISLYKQVDEFPIFFDISTLHIFN